MEEAKECDAARSRASGSEMLGQAQV